MENFHAFADAKKGRISKHEKHMCPRSPHKSENDTGRQKISAPQQMQQKRKRGMDNAKSSVKDIISGLRRLKKTNG
jgi:hypothetical protein